MRVSREWNKFATDDGRVGTPTSRESAYSRRLRRKGRLAAERLDYDLLGCVGFRGLGRPIRDRRDTDEPSSPKARASAD